VDYCLRKFQDITKAYVDDILIMTPWKGSTEKTIMCHDQDVRRVMEELKNHKLVADTKIKWFVTNVEFCGHVLGRGMRRPSPGKLRSLEKWPRTTNVTELRAFLGFCNWYQEYIKDYAAQAGPLFNMLKLKKAEAKAGCKKMLQWSVEANNSYNELKKRLLEQLELL